MLEAVVHNMEQLLIFPDRKIEFTDFGLAAIQAVSFVLGSHGTTPHGIFYHLGQSTRRKVQELRVTVTPTM